VFSISGEELGTIIQIASTSPRLKYLKLNISRYHKALVSMPSITFQHLQSLELVSDLFEEEHLRLLASVLWPSLMSLRYSSQQIYPSVVPCLLENTPKLKWFSVRVRTYPEFLRNMAKMFDQTEWPKLKGVCIVKWNGRTGSPPDHVPAVQKTCPNAAIHVTFSNSKKIDSNLFYGANLSPTCGWKCYKCVTK
jgi:hypothetical protein